MLKNELAYIEEEEKRGEEDENQTNNNSDDENDDVYTMRGFDRCEECKQYLETYQIKELKLDERNVGLK